MSRLSARLALAFAAYLAAGVASYHVAFSNGAVSVVYPAAGVALALQVRLGPVSLWAVLPAVACSSAYGKIVRPDPWAAGEVASALALIVPGTGLQAWVGYLLATRGGRDARPLDSLAGTLRLVVGGGFVACAVGAPLGVLGLCLSGRVPWEFYWADARLWFTGDLIGVAVVAPLVLAWTNPGLRVASRRAVEWVAVAGGAALLGLRVGVSHVDSGFLVIPLAVWAAYRLGTRGAATTMFALSAAVVAGCLNGGWSPADGVEALARVQSFLVMVALTSVVMAAVVAQRDRADLGLLELNRDLERRVGDRTRLLADAVSKLSAAKQEAERRSAELAAVNRELVESQREASRIFGALADALPGTVVNGQYRLESQIGKGGFGVVFAATHLALGRRVAVKVFRPSSGNDSPAHLERFRREGRWTAQLRHRHLVEVLDAGVSSAGFAYLVMELLNGRTLDRELQDGPLTVGRVNQVLPPVCEALAVAHAAGVVHRDVKPGNVFLHVEGHKETVKLMDFGVAKRMEPVEAEAALTGAGAMLGTPVYMAPESFGGEGGVGPASDIYGLGVTIYELLSGRPPFWTERGTLMGLAMGHLRDQPPPLVEVGAGHVPPEIEAIVRRCLSKRPEDRPTALELSEQFRWAALPYLDDPTHAAPPPWADAPETREVSGPLTMHPRPAETADAGGAPPESN